MCYNVKGFFKCMCYVGFFDVKGKGIVCKVEGMILYYFNRNIIYLLIKFFWRGFYIFKVFFNVLFCF